MTLTTVDSILRSIEALSAEDRELLEVGLAKLDEATWQKEAKEARRIAIETGVDQAHIEQTIRMLRRAW